MPPEKNVEKEREEGGVWKELLMCGLRVWSGAVVYIGVH